MSSNVWKIGAISSGMHHPTAPTARLSLALAFVISVAGNIGKNTLAYALEPAPRSVRILASTNGIIDSRGRPLPNDFVTFEVYRDPGCTVLVDRKNCKHNESIFLVVDVIPTYNKNNPLINRFWIKVKYNGQYLMTNEYDSKGSIYHEFAVSNNGRKWLLDIRKGGKQAVATVNLRTRRQYFSGLGPGLSLQR